MLNTRSSVIASIKSVCDDWGISLYTAYDPSLDSGSIPIGGMFVPNFEGIPAIDVLYAAHATPKQIWWCFLHEFGHCLQWLDHSIGEWQMAYFVSNSGKHSLEIDAWIRAEALARNSFFPPSAGFYALRRQCLDTYGINVDTVDFSSCKPAVGRLKSA